MMVAAIGYSKFRSNFVVDKKNSGYLSRRDINFGMTITSDCLLSYHWTEAK